MKWIFVFIKSKTNSKQTRNMWDETTTIEQYLDSLQKNSTYINLSNKGLTYVPSLKRFTHLKDICLDGNNLTHLPEFPEGIIAIMCARNQIESIEGLPDSVRRIFAEHNKIKHIHKLPNDLLSIWVSYNNIQTIDHIPPSVFQINFGNNPELTRLPELPDSLMYLRCDGCGLTRLPKLPHGLHLLYISNNPIEFIENIPTKIYELYCRDVPIIDKLNLYKPEGLPQKQTIFFYSNNINKLQRARELRHTLRLKDKLRAWLWEYVRLPKIERANHPDLLAKYRLPEYEDEDMEEVMSTFGR